MQLLWEAGLSVSYSLCAQKDMLSPLNEKLFLRRIYLFPLLLSKLKAVNMACKVHSVILYSKSTPFSSSVPMCITVLHLRLDSLAGAKIIYRYSKLFFPFMLFWCLEIAHLGRCGLIGTTGGVVFKFCWCSDFFFKNIYLYIFLQIHHLTLTLGQNVTGLQDK